MRPIPTPFAILSLSLSLAACGGGASTPSAPPAKAEPVAHETELLKIVLTPDAERRLGIETDRVAEGSAQGIRHASGEIVVPPSGPGGVPVGSAGNLPQIAGQQAAANGEVDRASAQVQLARIALNRTEALVRAEAGSVRARDEAAAALATANAALETAHAQRRLLGPSVAAMNRQGMLWVRVSVFGSDIAAIRRGAAATVRPLGDGGAAHIARPVDAPPSANATAGTVDLFYALSNGDRVWRVGQRVAVDLALSAEGPQGRVIPSSAVLRDINGGEWVYERTAPHSYVRQRVEVASEKGGQAYLSRGLRSGAEIVTTGAAELFGTEFGAAH